LNLYFWIIENNEFEFEVWIFENDEFEFNKTIRLIKFFLTIEFEFWIIENDKFEFYG